MRGSVVFIIVQAHVSRLKCALLKSASQVSVRQIYVANTDKNGVKLVELGKFEEPKVNENYSSGQLFLHKIFGYRGVILFSWNAKVYDRENIKLVGSGSEESEVQSATSDTNSNDCKEAFAADIPANAKKKSSVPYDKFFRENIESSAHTFYQVLVDSRDNIFFENFRKCRSGTITFFGDSDHGRRLYAVTGVDYVAHEDIIPFSASTPKPIHHKLFDLFFIKASNKVESYATRNTLDNWRTQNRCLLEFSDVHRQTSEGVRITVIPFYVGCKQTYRAVSEAHWWRYCLRLENLTGATIRLRDRQWRIVSRSGGLRKVWEPCSKGTKLLLTKQNPVLQYSSHVSLLSSSAYMWGTVRMEREDGTTFKCRIPTFSLDSLPRQSG